MSHALWEIILARWDEVNGVLDGALPPGTASGPGVGAAALVQLRSALHGRLDALERDLVPLVAEPETKRILFPLVLHLDERVLSRLPRGDKLSWRRLQDDVLDDEAGGEVFYARLDLLLRLPGIDAQSIVLEVYYFCLADGFHGRFDDQAAIDAYKRDIQKHLAPSTGLAPAGSGVVPPPPAKARRRRSPAFYYLATAALVVLIVVVPIVASNL